MSEIRAGWHDARRTPGARLLQGRKCGGWAYSFGYAVRVVAESGRKDRPAALGAALARGARRAAVTTLVIAAAFLLTHWLTGGAQSMTFEDAPAAPEKPLPKSSPAYVLGQHADDCWQGDPPADMVGEIPGAVIWQHTNGSTVYSTRLVGPALDTIFGDGDLAGTPIAFCR